MASFVISTVSTTPQTINSFEAGFITESGALVTTNAAAIIMAGAGGVMRRVRAGERVVAGWPAGAYARGAAKGNSALAVSPSFANEEELAKRANPISMRAAWLVAPIPRFRIIRTICNTRPVKAIHFGAQV